MADNLTVFGTDYTGVMGIKAKGTNNGTLTYIRPFGTKTISVNGTNIDVSEYESVDVNVTVGVSPTGNINITHSGVTDVTNYATATVPEARQFAAINSSYLTQDNMRKWQVSSSTVVDPEEGGQAGWLDEGMYSGITNTFNAVPTNTTVTPSTSSQTIGGANYMLEGPVTVAAMPTGTAGTPTATKGSVSNHSVSVTPSVTNTTGYITGGTKTGTAVTVSASELVSGTKSISANGTGIDVTEYASVDVAVPVQDNTFVIVVSWNTQTEMWEPDCTYAEVLAAVTAGKEIVMRISSDIGTADCMWDSSSQTLVYAVFYAPNSTQVSRDIYSLTSSGTNLNYRNTTLQVSGTKSITASGTTNVAQYEYASVAAGSATASATKGTVSNHSVTVTPSVTRTAGYVTAGSSNGTAVTVSASELVSGSETKTANGTYDVTNLAQLVVDVQGGSTPGMQVATAIPITGANSGIIFQNLAGEPTSFVLMYTDSIATSSTPTVAAIVYDGNDLIGQTITNTSNAQVSYNDSVFSIYYNEGGLSISTNEQSNIVFNNYSSYELVYTYNGTTSNIQTKDVQVGSGATSITFTGLDDEPTYFSCLFKSNFSTSSGYQRVIGVVYDGTDIYGLEMDSSAKYSDVHWTYSYSNGSLTITSQGTNAGGYFHQPGYYQLTYGIGGEVEPTEIDVQPLSVTQNGTYTAPTGVAYSPVTVAISGGGVSVGKTTWTNSSTSTVSHQFTGLSGTPKAAFLRCTSQLTRSSSNTYYYIADIVWDGTNAYGNYHLRYNGSYNNVASDAQSGFNVSVSGTSITFSSDATSRSNAPGSFYNGTYELVYIY